MCMLLSLLCLSYWTVSSYCSLFLYTVTLSDKMQPVNPGLAIHLLVWYAARQAFCLAGSFPHILLTHIPLALYSTWGRKRVKMRAITNQTGDAARQHKWCQNRRCRPVFVMSWLLDLTWPEIKIHINCVKLIKGNVPRLSKPHGRWFRSYWENAPGGAKNTPPQRRKG